MTRLPLVLACVLAAGPAGSDPRPATIVIDGVPHIRQRPDFCGEACVAMWANELGVAIDQDDVFAATGLDPALGRGAYTPELVHAVKALGFRPTNVYTLVDARAPAAGIARELAALRADLARGVPSIVCMHYDAQPHTTEHFRLVVGYDAEREQIVYHEPAEDDGAYRRMDRSLFAKLWPLPSSDPAKRVLVRIPLVPGKIVAPARADGISNADYAQHVMALRDRIAAARLGAPAIAIERPFVVVGGRGERRALRWAAHQLANGHDGIVDVFVFRGARAYERGVRALTGGPPQARDGFAAGDAIYVDAAAL